MDLRVVLGFGRSFPWDFTIADLDQPIIGTDFLAHFDLLADENNNRLIDN